jgi:hypothetical protein
VENISPKIPPVTQRRPRSKELFRPMWSDIHAQRKPPKNWPTLLTVLKAVCQLAGRMASPFSMYLQVSVKKGIEDSGIPYPKSRRNAATEIMAPLICASKPLVGQYIAWSP